MAAQRIVARDRLALASHRLALSPAEAEAKAGLERVYREAAFAPPSVADAAAAIGVPAAVVEKMAALLVRQRVLVRVDMLVFHADVLARLKAGTGGLEGGGRRDRETRRGDVQGTLRGDPEVRDSPAGVPRP